MGKRTCGFLLIFLFPVILLASSFQSSGFTRLKDENTVRKRIILVQLVEREKKEEGQDTHFVELLKQLKEVIDGWLKSLNERIEREDVSRFEVRFLEVLRSILEWVKEKIDAKIGTAPEERPEEERRKGGFFRQTKLRFFPLSDLG